MTHGPHAIIPILKTSRLQLHPLTLADAPRYQQLIAHWGMVRYITDNMPWPYPADEAERYIREDALPAMANAEEWHWTLRLRDAPELIIGVISLMDEYNDNRSFWIAEPWQNKGLVSEACQAVNRFWFQALGKPVLRVAKAAANEPSRRISMREGMRVVLKRQQSFVGGTMEEEIWQLTRDEWLSQQC
ncbi:GNAT family N-acetyltransferase [Pseudomonas coleopterorum]|uniref:GNAT family N-acetyltransferase n=1 Tax=Pseudomonas coleopterorum TaxID=1605838 RepID=A0AAJ6MUU3_9PSED|nr:GNAT family N-acetyltransferase [Pseudomonas coleopterorum]WNC11516.1 GNAT family N-acetyltransferase [Pseudomonas coleopterorum]